MALYRREDVALATRDAARTFQQHLRRQARTYRTAIVCLLVLLGTTLGLVWYRHFPDRRFPWTARADGEAPGGPFTVEDQGAVPAEGIAHRWRIRIAPEQPIPRWHPTTEERTDHVLQLQAGKAYRLRAEASGAGTVECRFVSWSAPSDTPTTLRLWPKHLAMMDGLPLLPRKDVQLTLRWATDTQDALVALVLEELQVPQAEYRDYLRSRGIQIQRILVADL